MDTKNLTADAAREWLDRNPIFLDTETTGTGYDDEIVSIALLDREGTILLDTLVKPTKAISASARAVHGITDEQVKDAPSFAEIAETIQNIIGDRELIIWNAEFDVRMLLQSQRAANAQNFAMPPKARCAMLLYAEFYGDWNSFRHSYRWQKLGIAASQCGIRVAPESLHGARVDTEVCRQIVHYMAAYQDVKAVV